MDTYTDGIQYGSKGRWGGLPRETRQNLADASFC